jgi:hypothetical protein
MISKSLSTSEKRAALHHVAGKLAEFCQAIYPLLIAHADDFGRLAGDVFTIKHLIDPTSPRKLVEFEAALMALHNVGLITWYQADEGSGGYGKWFVAIRSFAAHQTLKGHDKDGRTSSFPPPPENPNDFDVSAQKCPKSPKSALREEKRTEENLTHTVAYATTVDIDPDLDQGGVTQADIGAFLKRFCELFSRHRNGAKYFVKRHKDVPLLRQLLLCYPRDRLEKLTVVLLTTDDEWISRTDRGIGILSVKASWLDGLLAGYEAAHGTIQVAS